MIPQRLIAELEELDRRGWTGKLSFNFKDGKVIEIEHLERERLDFQTR